MKVKAKRLCAVLLASIMAFAIMGCKSKTEDTSKNTEPTEAVNQDENVSTQTEETSYSIDFSDGNAGFISAYQKPANAAEVELSVVDYNGDKALKIVNTNEKTPYIGIDVSSLCKEKTKDIASIEMTMGISYADGSFQACSGNVMTWTGSDLAESKYPWSVYLESKNPKLATVTLGDAKFVNDADNIMLITLETDTGRDTGHGAATLYISDISFLDASGNVIAVDTSTAFAGPATFQNTDKDMSNLVYLKDESAIEGFAVKGDAWAQAGIPITEDILNKLVPGAVLEIEFASESGDLWMVVTDAPNGWTRCGGQKTCTINASGNICQITYEQLMAWCGAKDVSELKGELQCESDTPWEVYSVKIGRDSGLTDLKNQASIEGFEVKGDAWAQAGIPITEDILSKLVPGSVLEIEYTSESGDLWMVVTDAPNGWSRCGGQGTTRNNGKVCQISYEELMAWCGAKEVSELKGELQCESDSAWEVYKVSVGTSADMVAVSGLTKLDGFAVKGDAWAQAGIDITDDMRSKIVPGCVIEITYTSESGDLWMVVTDAPNGWTRCGGQGTTKHNGKVCQITYDELMTWCNAKDVSELKGQLQCESDSAWEVYNVFIGTQVK